MRKRYAFENEIQNLNLNFTRTSVRVSKMKFKIVNLNFTRTSVRVSKINAVGHAQLTFEMLTLLQKYLNHHSQFSKRWGSKCLALIAQMVRAFGMDLKLEGSRHFRDIFKWLEHFLYIFKWLDHSQMVRAFLRHFQMVRAFGMNPKLEGSRHFRSIFCLSVTVKRMLLPRTVNNIIPYFS